MLPRHARCVLFRLRCNGHSLLLGSYLSRIGRIENSSCSACGHPSQDTSHLILHCPATDSLRRSLFGDSLSLYDLWSRPWGVSRLLGLHGLPPCLIPRKGSGNQQQQQQHKAAFLHHYHTFHRLKLQTKPHIADCVFVAFADQPPNHLLSIYENIWLDKLNATISINKMLLPSIK